MDALVDIRVEFNDFLSSDAAGNVEPKGLVRDSDVNDEKDKKNVDSKKTSVKKGIRSRFEAFRT
jgi:hypothetical protein